VRDATGGFSGALLFLAIAMAITALAILMLSQSMREMMRRPVLVAKEART
jgi:ACS family tartrate transporter-like MFS transporter